MALHAGLLSLFQLAAGRGAAPPPEPPPVRLVELAPALLPAPAPPDQEPPMPQEIPEPPPQEIPPRPEPQPERPPEPEIPDAPPPEPEIPNEPSEQPDVPAPGPAPEPAPDSPAQGARMIAPDAASAMAVAARMRNSADKQAVVPCGYADAFRRRKGSKPADRGCGPDCAN